MATQRDEIISGIRPGVKTEAEKEGAHEHFQNSTLRPILKFQNEIIIAQFRSYLHKFKSAFNAYNQNVQKDYIEDVMKADPRIKNSLIASTVSLFTIEEYDYYCANKNEMNKRLVRMITARLQAQLERLY